MAEILEQLNNLKELGYIQKAHLNVLEVALEDYKTEIRAKAIDETCLKIFNHLLSEIEWNRVLVDDWDALAEEFKEIAEQLKAGGKNEID